MRTSASLIALALAGSPLAANDKADPPGAAAKAARAQIERIEALDDTGPTLNAVIVYNPGAPALAAEAERQGLALAGRTVLVKDNIETYEWPTTAGSLALKDNATGRDAPLIARLRTAGGVVLGKTNLSEWANIRSTASTSGWSAVGGQTRNPHAIDRNTCGSSSGSGAAVAAGLSWAAIGTETDGSITCPASVNGIVGFKPSVGLVNQQHIVPISHSQDTAGPMARSVADAALLLNAIAERDAPAADSAPQASAQAEGEAVTTVAKAMNFLKKLVGNDASAPAPAAAAAPLATAESAARSADFTQGLATASLKGVRVGVLRKQVGEFAPVTALFELALADLRRAGAQLVEIEFAEPQELGSDELTVLRYELRQDLGAYLAGSPANIPVRSLADVIAFNRRNAGDEMRYFGQEIFEQTEQQQATDRAAYPGARANSLRQAGEQGIDRLLRENGVTLLVAPTTGPAWPIDLVYGDNYPGSIGAGSLAAVAGYPHLSVPMGTVEGLPVGLSIMGGKWQDHQVLKAGAAYERARTIPLPAPSLKPWQPAP